MKFGPASTKPADIQSFFQIFFSLDCDFNKLSTASLDKNIELLVTLNWLQLDICFTQKAEPLSGVQFLLVLFCKSVFSSIFTRGLWGSIQTVWKCLFWTNIFSWCRGLGIYSMAIFCLNFEESFAKSFTSSFFAEMLPFLVNFELINSISVRFRWAWRGIENN